MKLLANCSYRSRKLLRPSYHVALLLIMGLQVSGMTAFAKEARVSASHDKWTTKKGPQDTLVVEPFVEPSKSKLPLPSQKMLDDVLNSLKSFRVIDCGMDLGGRPFSGGINMSFVKPYSGRVVFESSDPKVLKELKEYLRIREGSVSSILGPSAPTFELTLVDGKVVEIGLAGCTMIRWKAWRNDADLLNPKGFISWLTNHGITGPGQEIQEQRDYDRLQDERRKASLDEFVRIMPKSLQEFFGNMHFGSSACIEDISKKYGKIPEAKRLKLARSALIHQFPNESKQIGVLLEWEGKITDYSLSFQSFPIELLLEYDPNQVFSKVKESSLSPAQWVGVSRYYSSWYFRRKFPSGYKLLDKALRERISKEVKATGKNQSDLDDFEHAMKN